jgi:hypothetical protein
MCMPDCFVVLLLCEVKVSIYVVCRVMLPRSMHSAPRCFASIDIVNMLKRCVTCTQSTRITAYSMHPFLY